MKKIISLISAAFLLSASLFAVDFSMGVRGNVNFALGTSLEGYAKNLIDYFDSYMDLAEEISGGGLTITRKKNGNIGGGFAFYGNISFAELGITKLSLQPEIAFNFNNGFKASYKIFDGSELVGTGYKFYTHTLEIPLLFEVFFPIKRDAFELGLGIGPQISFPIKIDYEVDLMENGREATQKLSDTVTLKSMPNFGMAFDLCGKMFVGSAKKFAIVIDIRYNLDFTTTKETESSGTQELFTRRDLNIGIGGEIRF